MQLIKHITRQATSTQLPHISGTDVGSVLLPVPPLEEQVVVAERCEEALRTLSGRPTIHRTAVHAQDELGRAILAKALRGELVPQDPNDEPAELMLARLRYATAGAENESRTKPRRTKRDAEDVVDG